MDVAPSSGGSSSTEVGQQEKTWIRNAHRSGLSWATWQGPIPSRTGVHGHVPHHGHLRLPGVPVFANTATHKLISVYTHSTNC